MFYKIKKKRKKTLVTTSPSLIYALVTLQLHIVPTVFSLCRLPVQEGQSMPNRFECRFSQLFLPSGLKRKKDGTKITSYWFYLSSTIPLITRQIDFMNHCGTKTLVKSPGWKNNNKKSAMKYLTRQAFYQAIYPIYHTASCQKMHQNNRLIKRRIHFTNCSTACSTLQSFIWWIIANGRGRGQYAVFRISTKPHENTWKHAAYFNKFCSKRKNKVHHTGRMIKFYSVRSLEDV